MTQYLLEQFKRSNIFKLVTILFLVYTVWWISIFTGGQTEGLENDWWANIMVIFPLFGGMAGIFYSKLWGGLKSALGNTIFMFSLGLLAQFVGTGLYFYYVYVVGVDIPYPSVADIAYVAGILFYIIGSYKLAQVLNVKLSSQPWSSKVLAILIPLAILAGSYWVLMRNYDFSEATLLLIFLDFGWLFCQAIFVSIAILIFFASKSVLGGIMRNPILLLIVALVIQYLADFHYSYQINNEIYYTGGINDYFYALAFYMMGISLASIGNMFYKVQES